MATATLCVVPKGRVWARSMLFQIVALILCFTAVANISIKEQETVELTAPLEQSENVQTINI